MAGILLVLEWLSPDNAWSVSMFLHSSIPFASAGIATASSAARTTSNHLSHPSMRSSVYQKIVIEPSKSNPIPLPL